MYGLLRKQPLALHRNYGALKNAAAAAAAANDGVRQPIIILSKALIDFSIGGVYCRSKTCVNGTHGTVRTAHFLWEGPRPSAVVQV